MIGWSPGTVSILRHQWAGESRIVGVVKDYHNQSLRAGIVPLVLSPLSSTKQAKVIYAKVGTDNLQQTLVALEEVWKKFLPVRPFEYEFLDDRFDALYRSEMIQRKIFTFFSVLAIFVGCLGTFGLVSYSARRRRKEMGIRKALGAGGRTVIYLLSQEFLALVLAAFAVATPIAYVFCVDWLNTFTYRIDLSIGAFLTGGLLTLGLVALSIATQTIRASRENPVDALRYE